MNEIVNVVAQIVLIVQIGVQMRTEGLESYGSHKAALLLIIVLFFAPTLILQGGHLKTLHERAMQKHVIAQNTTCS